MFECQSLCGKRTRGVVRCADDGERVPLGPVPHLLRSRLHLGRAASPRPDAAESLLPPAQPRRPRGAAAAVHPADDRRGAGRGAGRRRGQAGAARRVVPLVRLLRADRRARVFTARAAAHAHPPHERVRPAARAQPLGQRRQGAHRARRERPGDAGHSGGPAGAARAQGAGRAAQPLVGPSVDAADAEVRSGAADGGPAQEGLDR